MIKAHTGFVIVRAFFMVSTNNLTLALKCEFNSNLKSD